MCWEVTRSQWIELLFVFGGFGYRPEGLRFLINESLALCCVSVYFSCAAAAFMFEGLRIPIREHKVHCFRLDSVLGCYMPFLPYIGRCLGCLPLPGTAWGGPCFTEPTRLCWASGFLATHSVTVLMPNPSGTRALVLLTAGAYLFLRTRGFQMYLPTCHFRRSRFVCIGEAVKIRGVESFVVIIGLNNQLRSL